MLNFTVGPVMSDLEILEIASGQTPYFRTEEFSALMKENEKYMLKYLYAGEGSRCVFLTSSGTGAMEACVSNFIYKHDKVGIINGGAFGQRFVELCHQYGKTVVEIPCDFGYQVTEDKLLKLVEEKCTVLLVNMDETSSGVLYDMKLISNICRQNSIFLIVDAISSFISDELDMRKTGVDVVINSSQKAIAVQPGISMIAMNETALERLKNSEYRGQYFSIDLSLKNMDRGQTPFTPAVSILLQINKRFKMMEENGGITSERQKIRNRAELFRRKIKDYPLEFVVSDEKNRSSTVTGIYCRKNNAMKICNMLRNQYGIWVCPNGGIYKDTVFRVGHIGNITNENMDFLFYSLNELMIKKFL